MALRDIVNRENVNLTNCESEPIHIPGSIQPHGTLLAVDEESFIITYCSGNTAKYLDLTPQQLLEKRLHDIFPEAEVTGFATYLAAPKQDSAYPFVFTYNNVHYNTTVHRSSDKVVLELEPFPDGSMAIPNLYTQTRKFVELMENAGSLKELCAAIATETRAITGYDRVMIYRFDKDYNGEVFAESKREDLQPFLGLNYPHTDIPAQARELYLRNLMRMIADVNYEPVPVYTTENNSTNKDLDLSLSVLRSVSPIHIEYLKNMGVGATLTVSLIQNKKLWGMITCHHYGPRNIPHYTRLAALLQGHFLTSQIDVRQAADEYELKIKIELQLQELLDLLVTNDQADTHNFDSPLLLQITNASGVAVLHNGKPHTNGHVPPEPELIKLATWLFDTAKMGSLHTAKLIDIYPGAADIVETTAGLIYHSLGKGPQDCIIWFRPEVEKSINWAGDPAKAVVKEASEENNFRLSPRKSFELWKEIVRYQAREWQPAEIQAAESLAFFLQRQFNLVGSIRAENKYRQLSEKLQAANEELANINWISIHDLKEPLRKMQIFASRALVNNEVPLSVTTTDSIKRIQQSAARMQVLIDDLLAYSKITHNKSLFTPVDLNKVVHELQQDLSEEIAAKQATVDAGTLPVLPMIPFQARQLFANLLSNAIKFSHEDVPPHIKITAERTLPDAAHLNGHEFYKISVRDNGIGFDNAYSTKIFDVFKRLHSPARYEGTGIGLAICKKIAESHGGYITAEGNQAGAAFHVYLPVAID